MRASEKRRAAVKAAFDKFPDDESRFRKEVRRQGRKLGISPMMVIALIRLAMVCWQIWRAANLTVAPDAPMAGEPNFGEESG